MTESKNSSPQLPGPEATVLGTDSWCQTEVKVTKFSNTWTIHNFSLRKEKTGEELESSAFFSSPDDKRKWSLHMFPKGYNEASKDYLALFVSPDVPKSSEFTALFTLAILNADFDKTVVRVFKTPHQFTENSYVWGLVKFIKLELLFDPSEGLLSNDKLTIHCEIRLVEDSVNRSGQYKDIHFKVPECKICDELEQLLHTQKLSDVILSVSGHQINAHKAILAARSPVFSAMFEHEMEEKKLNRVEITDIDHKVVSEMLCFIYTGRAPKLETMAADLLAAADKYELDRLKVMCEEALSKNMSVESAARALYLAHKHSADQLKSYAIDYMTTHSNDMMKTLVHRQIHELSETCRALTTREKPPL